MAILTSAPETELEVMAPLVGGDPATWTPGQRSRNERMALFLRTLEQEGSVLRACEATGVSESTSWRWRDTYPSFDQAVTRFITRGRQERIEENMYRIATSKDPKEANAAVRAGEFLLKSLDDKYTDRHKIESTQTVNGMVQHVLTVRDEHRAQQQAALSRIRTLDVATGLLLKDKDE